MHDGQAYAGRHESASLAWKVTLPLFLGSSLFFGMVVPSLLTYFGFNLRFYLLDLMVLPLSGISSFLLDVKIRPMLAPKIHPIDNASADFERCAPKNTISIVEANDGPVVDKEAQKNNIPRYLYMLSIFLFSFGYPVLIVP